MYARCFLAILVLIGATLACSFPGMGGKEPDLFAPRIVANPRLITTAEITLDLNQATSSEGSTTPGWGCWPPFHNKEGSDSDITGSFTVSEPTTASDLKGECSSSSGAKATLTGTIDWMTETIEFTLVITSSQQLNISETIHGNGSFVSESVAEGDAIWSMTCSEKQKEGESGYICPAENAFGTVPWTMTFNPDP